MRIISIKEASEITNKSQKTIRRAIASKHLRAKKIQNRYRIDKNDLVDWMKNPQENINDSSKGKYKDDVNWIDIEDGWSQDYWNSDTKKRITFIDLFSGAGGLACGLVMAGFIPLASVEIMKEASETYKFNFINKKGFNSIVEFDDIQNDENKNQLISLFKDKDIDLISGGFPCQGFSLSGYRVVADPRNSLYLDMLDIVKKIKPKFIFMENVEGLRSMLNGKIEEKIINDYKNIGYDINVTVLNSADYGVPQERRRVIFIGNRIGKINYHPKPIFIKDNYVTIEKAIAKYLKVKENKDINHIFTKHSEAMVNRLKNVKEGESLYKNYSDSWKRSPWKKPSCTIKENHGGVNIHPLLPRVLTPRELATLQSFPEDFIFRGSKKWQLVQIGNAVPPLLSKAIGLSIKKSLK